VADSVDDSFLQRAVSSVPKRSIFLIEDIDCAFPSRDDAEGPLSYLANLPGLANPYSPTMRRSSVTLSGLLNVIDGVGSDDGKLFFATVSVARVSDTHARFDHVHSVRPITSIDWTLRCFVRDELTEKYSTAWRLRTRLQPSSFASLPNPATLRLDQK